MPEESDPRIEREQRKPVKLWASVFPCEGPSIAVIIVDMTYDGCKLTTPVPLEIGSKVKLSVPKLGTLNAEVRWYADEYAGLRFIHAESHDHEEDVANRKQERVELSTTVSLRRMGRTQYQARVLDLSPTGCKVEFVERPRPGEQLWVKFEGLDSIEATVRWVDGYYGGIEFVKPIHPAVFEVLQKRLK